MSIVNISAYKFISLDELPALRVRLLARCEALALKGTKPIWASFRGRSTIVSPASPAFLLPAKDEATPT